MPFFNTDGSWSFADGVDSPSVRKSIFDDDLWTPGIYPTASGLTLAAKVGLSKNMTAAECFALSTSFRAGVEAYDRNISRCLCRVYNRAGEVATAGSPVDFFKRPAPNLSFRRWMSCFVHSFLIWGEAAAKHVVIDDNKLYAVLPLEPLRLQPKGHGNYRSAYEVPVWWYTWKDGDQEDISSNRLMLDQCYNPLPGSIRGLAASFTGATDITAGHNAALWAKKYFDNSTQPGGMLILPDGVPENQRRDIERRFTAEHAASYGNAHRLFVISGSKDVKYEPLEQGFNDGNAFLELQKHINKKVGQLLGVPDIEMGGVEDDTRFKMAPEARKVFFEQRLAPMAERFSEWLQHQLVDPYMRFEKVTVARPRKPRSNKEGFSKEMGNRYEKAMGDRPNSGLIVLLDPDTLPIMGDVQLARSTNMIAFRDATMCSPKDACEFFAVDIENDDPVRDIIWTDQKYLPASDPELAKKLIPGLIPKPAGADGGGASKPAAKADTQGDGIQVVEGGKAGRQDGNVMPNLGPNPSLTPEFRELIDKAQKLLRTLRHLTVTRMAEEGWTGELWSLSEADAANELGPEMAKEIRVLRFRLRKMILETPDREAQIAGAKMIFAAMSVKSYVRKALNP